MNELIAKIKSEYKNILSQTDKILDTFDLITIDAVDFSASHKLEDEEWFQIKDFSKKDFYIEQCSDDYSTASLSQINNDDYKKISCICILQENERHFQRITPALFVNRKTLLDYSGAPKIIENRKQIEIRKESDAIYLNDSNTLYFKSISKIKSIFPGIEILHREATQPEVNTFLSNNFISLSDYPAESVGTQNRKRIADIGLKFENLNKEKQKKLIKYAKEKSGIDIENDAFVIDSEADLKNLLYAMDQRYYYADIYEENRIANSVRIVY